MEMHTNLPPTPSVSVRDLQQMLNVLADRHENLPRMMVNGLFDELTLEAVMTFQRDFFQPVTGIVTEEVWNAVKELFFQALLEQGTPSPLFVFPGGTFTTLPGQSSPQMRIAQPLFSLLTDHLSNFEDGVADGLNSKAAHRNLRALQRLAALPETGILDRAAWEFLTRLYHAYVTRGALRAGN